MATNIKHVKGNVLGLHIPLTIQIKTMVDGEETVVTEDFYPSADYPTYIILKKRDGIAKKFEASVEGNVAYMKDMGTLNVGTYQLEVLCSDGEGNPYRYMVRAIVEIVDATIDAGIEAGIEFNSEEYTLDAAIFAITKIEQGGGGGELPRREGNILYEEDGIYQIKDNSVYPIAHPDLSTQPSILPQRFGNLDIMEVLIPLGSGNEWKVNKYIPHDAVVLECSLFSDIAVANPLMRKKYGVWYIGIGNAYTDVESKDWWALVRYFISDVGGGDYGGYYGGDNDHDDELFIDLGLPSGTLWARGNIVKDTNGNYSIGKPTDYGCCFSWGNIDGHNDGDGYVFNQAVYDVTSGGALTTDIGLYDATYDAATATLGFPCRMPTKADFEELIDNTTPTYSITHGAFDLVSNINGKRIWFIEHSYMWSSTYAGAALAPWTGAGAQGSINIVNYYPGYNGFPVRAVQ